MTGRSLSCGVQRLTRAAALLASLVAGSASAVAAAATEGQPAPAIEATLLDGTAFSLAAARGQVVVINFWATWCAPCRKEMPALDAFYRQHRGEGLRLLAVSVDAPQDAAKVREVMRDFSFDAALDDATGHRGYGRIRRVPVTFVIDRRGVLRKADWYGPAGLDQTLLDQVVTPLLAAR